MTTPRATWVNGKLLGDDEPCLTAYDHGFTVGDGVFETVKVVDGVPFALNRHLARLQRSADGLRLGELDQELIRDGITQVLGSGGAEPLARLRITVTGGIGPLGSARGAAGPTIAVALGALPPWPETDNVVVVPWPRNERGAMAGIKTTSYAENVLALAHAADRGAGEAVFANTRGDLCEGTGSNVFVVIDGRLLTPTLSSGCLAGVTRALVLEWTTAEEQDVPVAALATAEEAFLTSTTRDVQPIRMVDGNPLPAAPGPVTSAVMETFAQRSAESAEP
jgi:branched-chain amino acid aminotransferase